MSFAFKQAQRVRKADEFQQAFRFGKRIHSHEFVLHYCFSGQKQARLGVVIRKKNVNRANQRNRIKRMAREVFRHAQASLPPCDVVINVKKNLSQRSNHELEQCLKHVMQRFITQAAVPAAV
jgi:ribonuclease P protein component